MKMVPHIAGILMLIPFVLILGFAVPVKVRKTGYKGRNIVSNTHRGHTYV